MKRTLHIILALAACAALHAAPTLSVPMDASGNIKRSVTVPAGKTLTVAGTADLSGATVTLPATVSGGTSSLQPLNSTLTAISGAGTTGSGGAVVRATSPTIAGATITGSVPTGGTFTTVDQEGIRPQVLWDAANDTASVRLADGTLYFGKYDDGINPPTGHSIDFFQFDSTTLLALQTALGIGPDNGPTFAGLQLYGSSSFGINERFKNTLAPSGSQAWTVTADASGKLQLCAWDGGSGFLNKYVQLEINSGNNGGGTLYGPWALSGTGLTFAGKTLTISNSLTLSGTDGASLDIVAGGTLGSAAFTASSAYDAAGAASTVNSTLSSAMADPTSNGSYSRAAHAAPQIANAHLIQRALGKLAASRTTPTVTTILSIGDSVADGIIYNSGVFDTLLRAKYGALVSDYEATPPILSGGAVVSNNPTTTNNPALPPIDYTISPVGVYWSTIGTGGTIQWGSTNGFRADTIKIGYLKNSSAGHFKVQTSLNGAAFADAVGYENVDAFSASPAEGIITLSGLTVGAWRVQLVGVSGNVVQNFPVVFSNATEGSVCYVGINWGSIALDNWVTPGSLVSDWLAAIAPDLVTVEFKDSAAIYTANLPTLQTMIAAANANADVVLVGTTSVQDSTAEAATIAQNLVARSSAATYGWMYYDAYNVLGSWARANADGLMSDGTHRNTKGDKVAFALLQKMIEQGVNNWGTTAPSPFLLGTSSGYAFSGPVVVGGNLGYEFARPSGSNDGKFYWMRIEARGAQLWFKTAGLAAPGSQSYTADSSAVVINGTQIGIGGAPTGLYGAIEMLAANGALATGISWASGANRLYYNADGWMHMLLAASGGLILEGAQKNQVGTASSTYLRPAGILNTYISDVTATATTSEQSMGGYTVPAGAIPRDGDTIVYETDLVFAANVTTKQVKFYIGATSVFDTTALAVNGGHATLRIVITRTGSSYVKVAATLVSENATLGTIINQSATIAAADASTWTTTLKVTLGTGAASGDVVQHGYRYVVQPAP